MTIDESCVNYYEKSMTMAQDWATIKTVAATCETGMDMTPTILPALQLTTTKRYVEGDGSDAPEG